MLIIRFLRFLVGYCIVEVKGLFPERFLNLCMVHHISLWNVERPEAYVMRLRIRRSGAERLARLAVQSGNDLKILSQHGVTYILSRYKKRYALLLGALVFGVLIYIMSAFIWSIEVTGNVTVPETTIREKLAALGVGEGTLRAKLDVQSVTNDILLEIPELSWIALNEKGSRLSVEVKERTLKPEIDNNKEPCDIVAKKNGYILSMDVYEGQKVAKPGTSVVKGDLLVTGRMILTEEKQRIVPASAKIMASVDYAFEFSSPPYIVEREYTGRTKKRWSLVVMNAGFNLFFNTGIGYDKYDKMIEKYDCKLNDHFYLPITLVAVEYREYTEIKTPITVEMQKTLCKRSLDTAASKAAGANEVRGAVYTEKKASDGKLTMTLKFQCIEDIAEKHALHIEQNEGEAKNDG